MRIIATEIVFEIVLTRFSDYLLGLIVRHVIYCVGARGRSSGLGDHANYKRAMPNENYENINEVNFLCN